MSGVSRLVTHKTRKQAETARDTLEMEAQRAMMDVQEAQTRLDGLLRAWDGVRWELEHCAYEDDEGEQVS